MMETLEMEGRQTAAGTGNDAQSKLEIRRVVRASRTRVFDAWTQPEIVHRWFGPGLMTVPVVELDVRRGGAYEIHCLGSTAACEGRPPDGAPEHRETDRLSIITGEYRKIVPGELLQFTWRGNWDPEETSLVTVALKDVEGGTEVTLTHERFATELSRDKHERGWTSSLAKLARALEG